MKPLNFTSLFALYFIMLIAFGVVTNIEDLLIAEFAGSILMSLISVVAAVILAFLTLKMRASESHNIKRMFNLSLIFYSFVMLIMFTFIFLANTAQLTLTKVFIALGLTLLNGLLGAKLHVFSISKTTA